MPRWQIITTLSPIGNRKGETKTVVYKAYKQRCQNNHALLHKRIWEKFFKNKTQKTYQIHIISRPVNGLWGYWESTFQGTKKVCQKAFEQAPRGSYK